MPKTHYEIASLLFAPMLERARELVKSKGWRAYEDWIDNFSHQDALEFGKYVDDPGPRSWLLKDSRVSRHAQMGAALMQAIVEFSMSEVEDEYNFNEVMTSPTMEEFGEWLQDRWLQGNPYATRQEAANSSSSFATTFNQNLHEVCHRKAGFRVYEVSPGLAQRLRHTELRGLTTDDLSLPYRSIYISIPPQANLEVFNGHTGMHRLHGMYITESREPDKRQWHIMAIGASKVSSDPFDDALIYFRTDFLPGQSLNDAIASNDAHLEEIERRALSRTSYKADIHYIRSAWRDFFSWAMNVIVYSTWPEADRFEVIENPEVRKALEKMQKHPKGSHQYEKSREVIRTQPAQRRIVLGRNFTEWQEPSQPQETPGTGSGTPLLVRTRVPGHWQRYWYGKKGHQEQRWKLKEPYWKGPEDQPEPTSVHVLR